MPIAGLAGVITIDDVIDVLVDEATEDIQRLGGAQPLDTPLSGKPGADRDRKRIGWLLLLFVTESLTGTVLRHFEAELAAGGRAVLLRAAADRHGRQRRLADHQHHHPRAGRGRHRPGRRAARRCGTSCASACCWGWRWRVVAYGRALTWADSAPALAATVALAILTIVVGPTCSARCCRCWPTKLKIDPTVVSGPVMSTLVDATGLFIYFTIAHMIMGV